MHTQSKEFSKIWLVQLPVGLEDGFSLQTGLLVLYFGFLCVFFPLDFQNLKQSSALDPFASTNLNKVRGARRKQM